MIKIVYFIAEMGNWKSVVKEQADCIVASGLYDAAEEILCVMATNAKKVSLDLPEKFKLVLLSKLNEYEFPALDIVKRKAKPGDKILYLHTKGVSRRTKSGQEAGRKWREFMMWGCVERWKENIAALENGFDCSGVQIVNLDRQFEKKCGAKTVYAGNFWWTTGEYIQTLPDPKTDKNRWLAEGWLFQGNPKANDLFNLTGGEMITDRNTFSLPDFDAHFYRDDVKTKIPRMPKCRMDIINEVIKTYGHKSYLEIGVFAFNCFNNIQAEEKECVDPYVQEATHNMTSDDFFWRNEKKYDCIFIDGLHTREQVKKDILNGLAVLNEGGTILLHDMNPETEFEARPMSEYTNDGSIWCGDSWKAFAELRQERTDLEMHVIDCDWGTGIIRRGIQKTYPKIKEEDLTFSYLVQHKNELMQIIEPEDFFKWIRSKGEKENASC